MAPSRPPVTAAPSDRAPTGVDQAETGAGVNPARAIGPMIPSGKFTDWWLYLVGPLVGGAIAATVYERFIRRGTTPSWAVPTETDP